MRFSAVSDPLKHDQIYRLIAENTPDLVGLHESDGSYMYASPSAKQLLKYTDVDFLGTSIHQLSHPEDQLLLQKEWLGCVAGQPDVVLSHRLRRKDGGYTTVETRLCCLPDPDGSARIMSVSRPVPLAVQAKPTKPFPDKASLDILETELVGMITLTAIRDEQGQVVDFGYLTLNEEAEWLIGYTAEELVGKTLLSNESTFETVGVFDQYVQVTETGIPCTCDRYFEREGTRKCFRLSIVKLNDGVSVSFLDVSAYKRLQDETQRTSVLQKAILDSTSYSIISCDNEGIVRAFNVGAEKLLGYRAEEVVGKVKASIFHDPSEIEARANILTKDFGLQISTTEVFAVRTPAEEATGELECTYVTKDGNRVPVMLSTSQLTDEQRNLIGFLAIARDISKAKVAQAELKLKETLLQKMAESSPVAFYVFDARTEEILYFNHRFCEIWNLEGLEDLMRRGELKARDILTQVTLMLKDGDQYDMYPKELLAVDNLKSSEEEIAFVDGSTIWRYASPIRDEQGTYFGHLYLYENITDRRLADEKIRENQASLAEAQRIAHVGGWTLDLDSQEFSASDEIYRILKLDPANPTLTFTEMTRKIHPDDVEQFLESMDNTINHGESSDLTLRIALPNKEIKHVRCQANAVRRGGEEIKAITGIIHDITQQKLAEEQLIAAKELAEYSVRIKEEFLANMSHEIRTPLNGIVGMTHLLSQSELSSEQQQFMRAIKFSADSLMVIINDILDLAKIESGKMQIEETHFDVRQVLKDVTGIFSIKVQEKGVEIFTKVGENVPRHLLGDSVRLNQILLNLIGNAVKFTQEGFIGVSVDLNESNDEHTEVVFSVKDTGIGIAKDKLSIIFESFTQASGDTTRRFGGTGLGLAICKKLVELQGGKIAVSSQLGRGSEFTFSILYKKTPTSSDQVGSNQPPVLLAPALPDSIRILLAEDNEINRLIALTMLGKWKATKIVVEVAINGLEVLAMMKAHDYDLILMDCQMPEMDGYTATRIIRHEMEGKKKQIPIIAVTASALKQDQEKVYDSGMDDFIPKPFEPQLLFEKIIKAIGYSNNSAKAIQVVKEEATSREMYDLTLLREIAGDDEGTLMTLLQKFIEKTPAEIQELQETIERADYMQMARVVHRLKSTSRFLGLAKLNPLLEEMEIKGRDKDGVIHADEMKHNLQVIQTTFAQVLNGLGQELLKF